jgi:hypothetical protein
MQFHWKISNLSAADIISKLKRATAPLFPFRMAAPYRGSVMVRLLYFLCRLSDSEWNITPLSFPCQEIYLVFISVFIPTPRIYYKLD